MAGRTISFDENAVKVYNRRSAGDGGPVEKATPFPNGTLSQKEGTTMSDLMLDVGQANELKLAMRRADYLNVDVKHLCESDILAQIRMVLYGYAEIKAIDQFVDLDEHPSVKKGWTVERHVKGGRFKWDQTQVRLFPLALNYPDTIEPYFNINQLDDELRKNFMKELDARPAFNANLLDFLLANPALIPQEWKRYEEYPSPNIYFPDTRYIDERGYRKIRGLAWNGCGWWEVVPLSVQCIGAREGKYAAIQATS